MSLLENPNAPPISGPAPVPGIDEPTTPQDREAVEAAVKDLNRRSFWGYLLGAFSIAAAGALAAYSYCSLHRIAALYDDGPTAKPLEVLYVSAGGHVLITVALIWFIYQMLRAAERMVLPRHLSTDPELARTLLGISSPQREVVRMVRQLLAVVAKHEGGRED